MRTPYCAPQVSKDFYDVPDGPGPDCTSLVLLYASSIPFLDLGITTFPWFQDKQMSPRESFAAVYRRDAIDVVKHLIEKTSNSVRTARLSHLERCSSRMKGLLDIRCRFNFFVPAIQTRLLFFVAVSYAIADGLERTVPLMCIPIFVFQ